MIIDLAIHCFSMWHHFRHAPGFDCIAYVDMMEKLGFTGVNLSLNDTNYRHLGGREDWRIAAFGERVARSGMSLEIDTSGTTPDHLRRMLGVARRMGAASLRTYTRHGGTPAEMMAATIADLKAAMPAATDAGVTIVLENHEDFTGPELTAIVQAVDHPRLKILYDYGNSQMVLEDPEEALDAVLPHVHSVHVKDHVMVRPEHAGELSVAGVPMGEGFLPIRALTSRILTHGLRRITFENVWAYRAPIRAGRNPIGRARLGEGSFRFLEPPFDPRRIVLDPARHGGAELVSLERQALDRGLPWFKGVLAELGVTGYRSSRSPGP
ncbi:MAG: sugar phosphate isomerase/epimerase [Alphaproteobacteria bacterium]|nr:sugar phosphate isomerase/epimerase [Alphaproteobacteria bacterium]